MRKEYERVKAESGGDAGKQYKARHILVKDEAEAKQIIVDLAGGGDFAKMAQEKTQDPGSKDSRRRTGLGRGRDLRRTVRRTR